MRVMLGDEHPLLAQWKIMMGGERQEAPDLDANTSTVTQTLVLFWRENLSYTLEEAATSPAPFPSYIETNNNNSPNTKFGFLY